MEKTYGAVSDRGRTYCRGGIAGILVAVSLIAIAPAHAFVAPDSGVWTSDGKKGRVETIYDYDKATGNARAKVNLRDGYGNWYSRNQYLKRAPSKVARYGLMCVRNWQVCATGAAITVALVAAGIEALEDGFYRGSAGGTEYPGCSMTYHNKDIGGNSYRYLAPIPCIDQRHSARWRVRSPVYDPALVEWSTSVTSFVDWYAEHIDTAVEPKYGTIYIFERHFSKETPEALPEATPTRVSDAEVADLIMADPDLWNVEGYYPDIWEPIPAENNPPPTDEEIDQGAPPEEKPGDWASMDDVPREVVDVSSFLSFGSGWLPKSCPADYNQSFNILGSSHDLTISWEPICYATSSYLSPFVRMAGVFAFLTILFRGKQGG